MFKTKLTVEFEIETQFGPQDAINMVDVLTRVPAIKSVEIRKLTTDYDPTGQISTSCNVRAMENIPLKIR